jgi:hypothetical protein
MFCIDSFSDSMYDVVSAPEAVDRLLLNLGMNRLLLIDHLLRILYNHKTGIYYAKNRTYPGMFCMLKIDFIAM